MPDPLTKEDVREAVKQGVEDALLDLGIDSKDPIQVQQDFAYLRRLRKGAEIMKSKVFIMLATSVFTAIVTFVIMGFQSLFGAGK